jgi:hypothetical protein
MIRQEWPAIRAEIDGGHPAAMGLNRVISSDPFELKRNHQVLAYGYGLVGTALTLHQCDPNRPPDDHVRSRSASRPGREPTSWSSRRGPTVLLRVPYTRAAPPAHAP